MKFDYLCIIPECFADTNLVQTLLQMKDGDIIKIFQNHGFMIEE